MTAPDCRDLRPEGTCIPRLAAGWIEVGDLCSVCTSEFMDALDRIDGPLVWSEGFQRRAVGGGS